MTVTHIFRAMNRPHSSESEADLTAAQDSPVDETPPPLARQLAIPTPATPDTYETGPVSGGPLILGTQSDSSEHPQPADSAQPDRFIAQAVPASHGQIARFSDTEGRIILVAKARGGIGATTLAVNLALEMQLLGMKRHGPVGGRVALVDLDVQLGNAGSFLDLADRGGMLALARLGPEPDDQAVRHAMVRHPSGLSVLTAPATAIPFEAFDARRIASILDVLAASHDVVIVDLPPALIDWLEPLLARAERLLMVTDLAVPSITRARRIISLMTEDRSELPVEIVVAHERKPFRLGQTQRDAATALGHDLRHWLPDESKLARKALDRGEPLVQLAPRCGWSKAVKAMASNLQVTTKNGVHAARKVDH
jgi:Flp pilus assembly CpaE family ATPase